VSATTLSSIISGEQGTLSTVAVGMKKPCTECQLITMQAGLEYKNGSLAEPENGGWLHHIVVAATGASRKDTACNMPLERFFSSGNEKTPTAFGDVVFKNVKSAFPIVASDTFSAELELMNMIDIPLQVWITIDYEFMPGPRVPGWKVAKALWLDITNCGISYYPVAKGTQTLGPKSTPWKSAYDGEMLGVGGHLHDGGTNVLVVQTLASPGPGGEKTKIICDSQAQYEGGGGHGASSTAPKAAPKAAAPKSAAKGASKSAPVARSLGLSFSRRDGPHSGNDGMAHIKKMTTCSRLGPLKKGDTIHIQANYDFNKRQAMKTSSGGYAAVMGIAILYMAVDI
jgi:hypothetical protein